MQTTKKINLYIVDDEPGICKLIKIVFTEFGYDVREIQNGKELLDKLNKENLPDIILLDIMMPGIDGYEVCRKIKSNEKFKNVKVILYTALPEYAVKEKAMEVKADAYINKDIDPEELSQIIKDLLLK